MNIWQMHRLDAVAALAMCPVLAFCVFCQLYLCRLVIAAVGFRKSLWRAPRFVRTSADIDDEAGSTICQSNCLPKLLVIIPAHDEELMLGSTLDSIAGCRYPSGEVATLVIADNCSDSTAIVAAKHGAWVAIRTDPGRVGKGYALQDAVSELLNKSSNNRLSIDPHVYRFEFDAAVFLDADTIVHHELLRAFASRLNEGDEGMQGCYGVSNAHQSMRTRLMVCALAIAHLAKPAGREKLGLSDGLKGNGFCLSRRLMNEVQWSGESITEDIEYTLRLCEAGHRIRFVPDALLWAQMPTSSSAAAAQRTRWEAGRYYLLRTRLRYLLTRAYQRKDRIFADRVIDLIIPPFVELAAIQFVLFTCSICVLLRTGWILSLVFAALSGALLGVQGVCLLTSIWLARIPLSIAVSLMYAPLYAFWKLMLVIGMLVAGPVRLWRRTARHSD